MRPCWNPHRATHVGACWCCAVALCASAQQVVLRSKDPPEAGSAVVVGASVALDCCSAFAEQSKLMLESWEVFMTWLSGRGGLLVNGTRRALEIRIGMDSSDPVAATAAYSQHVRDGVRLLVAPYGDAMCEYGARVANASGALLLCPSASHTPVLLGRPRVFSTAPPSSKITASFLDAVIPKGAKTVGCVAEDSPVVTGKCQLVEAEARAKGLTLVLSRVMPARLHAAHNATAAQQVVAELQAVRPDVVVAFIDILTCQDFGDALLASGWGPGAVVLPNCLTLRTWVVRDEAGSFFTGVTPWLSTSAFTSELTGMTARGFAEAFPESIEGKAPDLAAIGFAVLEVLVMAIEASNSTDPGVLAALLRQAAFNTIYGRISFDANRQADLPLLVIQRLGVDGPPAVIAPPGAAAAPMRYPMPSQADRVCMSPDETTFGFNATGHCAGCPEGFASVWNGSQLQRNCFYCPAGSLYVPPDQCTQCPAGAITILPGQPQCSTCEPGTYAAEPGQSQCASCPPGEFAAAGGATDCEACPMGTFNRREQQASCLQCLLGTFSDVAGAVACQVCNTGSYAEQEGAVSCTECGGGRDTEEHGSKSPDDCVCVKDSYLRDGKCVTCPALYETAGAGATSSSACSLTGQAKMLIILVVVAGVLAPTVFWLLWLFMMRKVRKMERLRLQAMEAQLERGLRTINEFEHPMVVVSAADFLELSDADLHAGHEAARDQGICKVFDSMSQVAQYRQQKAEMRIVLFSYEWLSWVAKGPNSLQAEWMRRSLVMFCKRESVDIADVFVWLDVLSIPQVSRGVQSLAINSLYTYASSSDAMIIISPDSVHEDTKDAANLETYKRRVWTRMEQVAHVAAHGLETLYVAAEADLHVATEAHLESVVDIFSGDMTCCRLNHQGRQVCDKEALVLPLLGLWYLLRGGAGPQNNTGHAVLHRLIKGRIKEIFPPTFAFTTDSGEQERPLFSDLIELLETHLREERGVQEQPSSSCGGHHPEPAAAGQPAGAEGQGHDHKAVTGACDLGPERGGPPGCSVVWDLDLADFPEVIGAGGRDGGVCNELV